MKLYATCRDAQYTKDTTIKLEIDGQEKEYPVSVKYIPEERCYVYELSNFFPQEMISVIFGNVKRHIPRRRRKHTLTAKKHRRILDKLRVLSEYLTLDAYYKVINTFEESKNLDWLKASWFDLSELEAPAQTIQALINKIKREI